MGNPAVIEERKADFGLNINKVQAFSLKGVWDRDTAVHLNIHSSHQILTVQEGVVLLEDEREKQPLYRNMAALIPAGTPHRASVIRDGKTVLCNSLFVNRSMIRENTGKIRIFEISDLGAALLRKLNEKNFVNLTKGIMDQCLQLFIEVLQADMDKKSPVICLPEASQKKNKRIVQFIKMNYMNKIRLEHLAQIVPLSIRQISRSFQQDLNISIFEYIKLYRMLQASVLLHEKRRKIIDIAFDCGYDSTSTFYEDFKQCFGLSPNRFRKKILD